MKNHLVVSTCVKNNQSSLFKFTCSSFTMMCSTNEQGEFVKASADAKQLLGYLPEELIGKSYFGLVVEQDKISTLSILQAIRQSSGTIHFENRCKRKDGTIVFLGWSAWWDQEEKIMQCVARMEPTETKREEAAQHQDFIIKRTCREAKLGLWELDTENNRIYSSDELFEIYGLNKGNRSFIPIEEFLSLVHPGDIDLLQEGLSQLHQLTTHTQEHRLINSSTREIIYLRHNLQAVRDDQNKIVTIYGTTKDITELKKIQLALEESEKNLQLHAEQMTDILETLGDGFVTVDRNFTITYWNKKAEELLHLSRSNVLGKNLWDVFPEAVATEAFTEYNKAFKENIPVHFEYYNASVDLFVEISAYPSKSALSVYFRNINDKKKKELELKISNERFEFVSKATSDAIWDWNIETNTCYFNESFTLLFGYTHIEQDIHDNWINNIHPEDKDKIVSDVNNALNDPSITHWNGYFRFIRSNGQTAYVFDRGLIIRDRNGKAIRMVGSLQDNTKQKEAELLLGKNEKRFRAMVQSGQDLITFFDKSFKVRYQSTNFRQITGYSIKNILGDRGLDLIHPDDKDTVMKEAFMIHSRKVVHLSHYRFKAKDGSYKWFETTLTNFLDDQDIHAIICNTRDITARKTAFSEVITLSTMLQETLNSVIVTDPSGVIRWVNKAFTKKTEYTLEEVVGKHPVELLRGADICKETLASIKENIRNKSSFQCELVCYSKSGKKLWIEMNGQAILNEKGGVKHFFILQTDITARKEAEETVKSSEERYKLLFYKSPYPRWILEASTYRFAEVNDAACKLYGYTREEFLNLTGTDIRAESDRSLFSHQVQNAMSQKEKLFKGIVRHRKKTGEEITVELTAHGIEHSTGFHFLVTAYDMTEKLTLQNKIIEEKVAAQKEIAKMVIQTQEKERSFIGKELHDNINQILTSAKLCVENTKYYPEHRDAFTDRSIGMIQNAIQEIRNLSKALVSPAIYDVGLKAALLELLGQYRELNRFEIIDVLDFNEELMDNELKVAIYRILQELLNNMVKYAQATMVHIRITHLDEHSLDVLVGDNGIGFDTAAKKKGLGLTNIRNRVELFRGRLEIQSSPRNGCQTKIRFSL